MFTDTASFLTVLSVYHCLVNDWFHPRMLKEGVNVLGNGNVSNALHNITLCKCECMRVCVCEREREREREREKKSESESE